MLPNVDPTTRLLPATPDNMPHSATLEEVRDVFVERAPNRERRRLVFRAFELYSELVWDALPAAKLWLNGGFVTYKDAPPHDLDVLILASAADINQIQQLFPELPSVLTLQGVTSASPQLFVPRLQSFGGLIDSFIGIEDDPVVLDTWSRQWSTAPTPEGDGYRDDIRKGYLEVTAP